MTRKYDLIWRGRLTVENIEEIAKLLSQLLDGKSFILVTSYEYSAPDITQNVKIDHEHSDSKEAIACWRNEEEGSAGINIATTQEIGHFYTILRDGKFDSSRQGPFVTFEGDRVTITFRSSSGIYCHWQAVVIEEENVSKATRVIEKKEMTLEEFLAEIRAVDVEPLSAEKIRNDFKRGLTEINCADNYFNGIRLLSQGDRVESIVTAGYEKRKELMHLQNVIISDLKEEELIK